MPSQFVLNNQEVHLWVADFTNHTDNYLSYRELLTDQEKKYEGQFVTDILKRRFTISRSLLRKILKQYMTETNDKIDFFYGANGKPFLVDNPQNLQFNLSHSQNMTIYGISRGISIGVDVEFKDPNILKNELESMVLSNAELERFYGLTQLDRVLAFYHAWTRKEAILKAIGIGLSKPLQDIEVTFGVFEKPKIISIDGKTSDLSNWSLHTLEFKPDYVGAIAAMSSCINLKIFNF